MSKIEKQPITVIFDFDGTIANTLSFYFELLNKLADKFGFKKISPDKIDLYRNMSSHEVIEMLSIPRLKLPFIVLEARKLLKKGLHNIQPVDQIKDTIEKIKNRNVLLGIITSNSIKNVNSFLKTHKFPQFDFVFSSLRIWEKSRALKKVLINRKLNNQQVFYIGDETRDIEAAHEAKISAIAVTWGYNSESILKSFSPEFLISDPKRILDIIDTSLVK